MSTESIENAPKGDSGQSTETAAPPSNLVSSIESFVAAHGGSATVVLQPLGRAGVRMTLVGADGILGDRVAGNLRIAHAVVDSLDSVTLGDWDRELTSIVTPRKGHFAQMAGWVARQSHFPKARNGL
ncbi:hypothetical protein [Rhodococcus sp. MEB041]|uniref:hypothetical protein n=1 Tax=Rhodococcus sp. MEB041 TaxID=3040323 RepID=UPI00254EE893|nr:hypothetical protein [Rhodococcus sp. MEB041]